MIISTTHGRYRAAAERLLMVFGFAMVMAAGSASRGQEEAERRSGSDKAEITGELQQWHKVTLSWNGPTASEQDSDPNAFVDREVWVRFTHESGRPDYLIPGYFAADGNAANTGASEGHCWRAHLSPDQPGRWSFQVYFLNGKTVVNGQITELAAALGALVARGHSALHRPTNRLPISAPWAASA